MELKGCALRGAAAGLLERLNRTFYGIERAALLGCGQHNGSLNRTFYGIESDWRGSAPPRRDVLIVPFMELKAMRFNFKHRKPLS